MTTADSTPHSKLAKYLRDDAVLGSVASIISWDEQTQLPPAATDLRADQSSMLAMMSHKRATAPELGEMIAAAERHVVEQKLGTDSTEATVAREARRDFDRSTKLPADLVEALARAQVVGHQAWVSARKADDFNAFQPHLDNMLGLKRQEADCVGHDGDRYNALLDDYEPGETSTGIEQVFTDLKDELVTLVAKIQDSGRVAPRDILRRHYPVEAQRNLSRQAAQACGFDFDAGRLDVAVHPFCTGIGPGDTRLTTRFDEHEFAGAFFGTLHETGHGLYEQNLPKIEHFGNGCGMAISLGIHESQSRTWENPVGRSQAFWEHFWPIARKFFPAALNDVRTDDFLFAINDVRPSFIRVESDEATYNLHILLRFELERAMLSGDLNVADLPGAWNERMQKYLGITPSKDSLGCLQDVHWSAGYLGYFPTYTLGNLYGAQFFESVTTHLGGEAERDSMFARGEFQPLLDWLITHIHSKGRRSSARELVNTVTGRELTAQPLLNHLKRKAAEFYGV